MELNKREPLWSHEQCFAKVYCSPDSIDIRIAEREANGYPAGTGWRGSSPPVARTEPLVEQVLSLDGLQRLADELRQKNLWLTATQCFARVMSDPSNRDLVRQEREASRRALGAEL